MAITADPEFDPACGTYISWSGGLSLPETFWTVVWDDDLPWHSSAGLRRTGWHRQVAQVSPLSCRTSQQLDRQGVEAGKSRGLPSVRLDAWLEAARGAAGIKIDPVPDAAMQLAELHGDGHPDLVLLGQLVDAKRLTTSCEVSPEAYPEATRSKSAPASATGRWEWFEISTTQA